MTTLTKNILKMALVPGSLGLLCVCVQEGSVLAHLRLCQTAPPSPKSSSCGSFKFIPDTQTTISRHLPAAAATMRCFISLILGLLALEVALARSLQDQALNSGRP